MERRDFIKKIGFAAGAPIALQGVPIKLLAANDELKELASASTNNRVLVILQMHGGNDGLNTFVPLSKYDEYYSKRPNIALPYKVGKRSVIPLDSTVPLESQVGLHPDMGDFKYLYDTGRAAVFQGISLPKGNGSHFRGRDIFFMGGGFDDYFSSGWVGRYLSNLYAPLKYPSQFPNKDMPDPLALEMGNDVSLIFHQKEGIPVSISVNGNPKKLSDKIEKLEGFEDEGIDPRGIPPKFLDDSPYSKEMKWILSLEDKSEEYIKRLGKVYESSKDATVDYPEVYPFNVSNENARKNNLSGQLRLIARLLAGGIKTKVFLVRVGGFDTHAEQVESYDPTMGIHAALLYHINSAMRAFQKDLSSRGLEDRVLTVTTSEFGRRITSNGSFGTDHGVGGPLMIFGKKLRPGIYGVNPDLSKSNVPMQYDYRQIYSSILHEWMEADKKLIEDKIFFKNFIDGEGYSPLNLISDEILSAKRGITKYGITSVYPNPADKFVKVEIAVNGKQNILVQLISSSGKIVTNLQRVIDAGTHHFSFILSNLPSGIYFIKAKSELIDDTKKLMVK